MFCKKKGGEIFSFDIFADGSDIVGFGNIILEIIDKGIKWVDYLKYSYCLFFSLIVSYVIENFFLDDYYEGFIEKFRAFLAKGLLLFCNLFFFNSIANIPCVERFITYASKWCYISDTEAKVDSFFTFNHHRIFFYLALIVIVVLKLIVCLINIASVYIFSSYMIVYGIGIIALLIILCIIWYIFEWLKILGPVESILVTLENCYNSYLTFIHTHHFWGTIAEYLFMILSAFVLPVVDTLTKIIGLKLLELAGKKSDQ